MNRFYHVVYALLHPILGLIFPFRVVGVEHVPEGRALLCPNHASAIDPIVVALALPNDSRIGFMAKKSLFEIPVLKWLLRKLGAFPVNRDGNDLNAIKTAMKVLQDDGRLMIFPEGTRVEKQGDTDAKTGVVMLSTRTAAPMIPIYCGGKKKLFHKTTVVFGEPYVPQIAGRRPTPEESRHIAEELLERIYALGEVKG